jgi:hypothetical protein
MIFHLDCEYKYFAFEDEVLRMRRRSTTYFLRTSYAKTKYFVCEDEVLRIRSTSPCILYGEVLRVRMNKCSRLRGNCSEGTSRSFGLSHRNRGHIDPRSRPEMSMFSCKGFARFAAIITHHNFPFTPLSSSDIHILLFYCEYSN